MIYNDFIIFFKSESSLDKLLDEINYLLTDNIILINKLTVQISCDCDMDDIKFIAKENNISDFNIIDKSHILYKPFNSLPEEKTLDELLDKISEKGGTQSLSNREYFLLVRLSEEL